MDEETITKIGNEVLFDSINAEQRTVRNNLNNVQISCPRHRASIENVVYTVKVGRSIERVVSSFVI